MVLFLKRIAALLPLPLFLLCCANTVQENASPAPQVRAAFKASGNGTVKATVFVEGPDGNALSGAVVTIRDERNSTLPLTYDSASCSYNGSLDEYAGETRYTVEVASVLLNKPLSLSVPFSSLAQRPNVLVFQDALGNSVLSGQRILAAEPVQIAWSLCGEKAVYQIAVKTALKTVYAVSTDAGTITIPANALPPGAYMLEISAQSILGDMYYKTAPYYAVSAISAPLVSCNVQ